MCYAAIELRRRCYPSSLSAVSETNVGKYAGLHWHTAMSFFQMIQVAKNNFQKPFFVEVFIIAAWQIWKQRNGKVFENITPSFTGRKILFKQM